VLVRRPVISLAFGFVLLAGTAYPQTTPRIDVNVLTPAVEPHEMVRLEIDTAAFYAGSPVTVTIDTRALGGQESFVLPAQGQLCDTQRWRTNEFCMMVPAGLPIGPKVLPITATDALGRRVTAEATVTTLWEIDIDGDGLPDGWERTTGINLLQGRDATGDGDPDGDGLSTREEFARGTHPRAAHVRYLAEGASINGFRTRLALFNTSPQNARGQIRYLRRHGPAVVQALNLYGFEGITLDPARTVPGLAEAEFSIVVESNVQVTVERTMTWDDTGYGSHTEMATSSPSPIWYLAEGATHSGFELFYLLQNPSSGPADVRVTYLLQDGRPPLVQHLTVAAASRENIWVNHVDGLASAEISAVIETTNHVPIIVERALYRSIGNTFWAAGHDSLGVTAPSPRWFFAEGSTGDLFDLFLLLANPTTSDGIVDIDYLFEDGTTLTKAYPLRGQSRTTIWVDQEDARLRDAAVSMVVEARNGLPIIAERSMWWPGPTPDQWQEGHNTPGTTTTGTLWALADGVVANTPTQESFVLVANTSPFPGTGVISIMGTARRSFILPPKSRVTLDVRTDLSGPLPQVTSGFIESVAPAGVEPAQIVVEHAMYASDGGTPTFSPYWPAGSSAIAEKVSLCTTCPLVITSEFGDYVGAGVSRGLDLAHATLTVWSPPDRNELWFEYAGDGVHWQLTFAAPYDAVLVPGTYEGAKHAVFRDAPSPGLHVWGEARSCQERSVGRFVIHEIVRDQAGTVTKFHADFEQRCVAFAPALRGTIRFGM